MIVLCLTHIMTSQLHNTKPVIFPEVTVTHLSRISFRQFRINCFVRTNEDKQLTPGRIHTQWKINLLFVSVDDLNEFCQTD